MEDQRLEIDENWMSEGGLPPKEAPNIDDQLVLQKVKELNADPDFRKDKKRIQDLSNAVRISLMSKENIKKALQVLGNPENPQSPDGQSPDAQHRDTAA